MLKKEWSQWQLIPFWVSCWNHLGKEVQVVSSVWPLGQCLFQQTAWKAQAFSFWLRFMQGVHFFCFFVHTIISEFTPATLIDVWKTGFESSSFCGQCSWLLHASRIVVVVQQVFSTPENTINTLNKLTKGVDWNQLTNWHYRSDEWKTKQQQ